MSQTHTVRGAPSGESHPITQKMRPAVAVAALLLVASTWRLWTPQTVFPQVPLISLARHVPAWCEWTGFVLLLISLVVALFAKHSSRRWRRALLTFVAIFFTLMLVDQNRLQPWAYQLAIISIVLVFLPEKRATASLKLLTVGIYFHSALSKLDAGFFDTHGQYLLGGLVEAMGFSIDAWSLTVRKVAASALPIGELLVAVGLCVERFRRLALWGAIVMHVSLIVALGPLGKNHEWGVLIWNVFFIVQTVFLFGPLRRVPKTFRRAVPESEPYSLIIETRSPAQRIASAVVVLAVLLPFLGAWGYFDVWPSWALYASKPARIRILIDLEAKQRLPKEFQEKYVRNPRYSDTLCAVRIDRWALDTLNAPLYPQDRFQLGIALDLAHRHELDEQIHVEMETAANRFSGKRTLRRLDGKEAIRQEAARFRLNALPRRR